jgi:hypothetical protein
MLPNDRPPVSSEDVVELLLGPLESRLAGRSNIRRSPDARRRPQM